MKLTDMFLFSIVYILGLSIGTQIDHPLRILLNGMFFLLVLAVMELIFGDRR